MLIIDILINIGPQRPYNETGYKMRVSFLRYGHGPSIIAVLEQGWSKEWSSTSLGALLQIHLIKRTLNQL